MRTAIVVHRWFGSPECDWIPWLREELEQKGVKVIVPEMPDPNTPRIETWVPFLSDLAKDADDDFYFVGHSVGCQTILRYLATLPEGRTVGGVVFVAGWVTLANLTSDEVPVAKQWLETPIDWDSARSHSNAYVSIYSDDDPYVPTENSVLFAEKLNAKLVLDQNRGHFTDEDDVTQLPILLKELLTLMVIPFDEPLI